MTDQIISPLASVSHISLMQRPYGPRIHMDENAPSDLTPVPLTPSNPLPADAPASFESAEGAARYMLSLKGKKSEQSAESAETATAGNELAKANDGPETAPIEEPEGNDAEAEKLPPIERPRSWSKDDDDDWNALPRARQEKIATNERAREADINRRINETAEKLKGLTAKEQQAEQARQQYETKIASAMEVLEREQLRDFPDIKTFADIERMAAEDPFRKIQWDTHQQKMSVTAWEQQQAQTRQAHERQSAWQTFVRDESAAFAESSPEYKAKKADYDTKAADVLRDLGFSDDELNKLASGSEKIPLFDRRIQRLIFDRIKLSEIQSASKAVAAKPVPPVQRPGTSRPAGTAVSEQVKDLTRKLNETGDIRFAQQLRALQTRARRAS